MNSDRMVRHLIIRSRILGRDTEVSLLTPGDTPPCALLLLLHGLGGNAGSWLKEYPLAELARNRRLLIVMPDGGRSYYVNDPRPAGHGPVADYLCDELIPLVERDFPMPRGRASRCTAGLSMGGYGALALALRRPDLFGAAISLSGSLYFGAFPHPRDEAERNDLMCALPPGAFDCFRLAWAIKASPHFPALTFNCGLEDSLLPFNRMFHEYLVSMGRPHRYEEFPGGHDRVYWSARLPDLLDRAERSSSFPDKPPLDDSNDAIHF